MMSVDKVPDNDFQSNQEETQSILHTIPRRPLSNSAAYSYGSTGQFLNLVGLPENFRPSSTPAISQISGVGLSEPEDDIQNNVDTITFCSNPQPSKPCAFSRCHEKEEENPNLCEQTSLSNSAVDACVDPENVLHDTVLSVEIENQNAVTQIESSSKLVDQHPCGDDLPRLEVTLSKFILSPTGKRKRCYSEIIPSKYGYDGGPPVRSRSAPVFLSDDCYQSPIKRPHYDEPMSSDDFPNTCRENQHSATVMVDSTLTSLSENVFVGCIGKTSLCELLNNSVDMNHYAEADLRSKITETAASSASSDEFATTINTSVSINTLTPPETFDNNNTEPDISHACTNGDNAYSLSSDNFPEDHTPITDVAMVAGSHMSNTLLEAMRSYAAELCPVDCVIMVERCRPFNSDTQYMKHFREYYLSPILNNLNGGPPLNADFGRDAYTSLYSLHGFHWKAPLKTAKTWVPDTPNIHRIMKRLSSLQHEERHVPTPSLKNQVVNGESLATDCHDLLTAALHNFDAIDRARRGLCRQVERHLILLLLSPVRLTPLLLTGPAGDASTTPLGQLRSRGVALSVCCPVRSASLLQLYELVNGNPAPWFNDRKWQTVALSLRLLGMDSATKRGIGPQLTAASCDQQLATQEAPQNRHQAAFKLGVVNGGPSDPNASVDSSSCDSPPQFVHFARNGAVARATSGGGGGAGTETEASALPGATGIAGTSVAGALAPDAPGGGGTAGLSDNSELAAAPVDGFAVDGRWGGRPVPVRPDASSPHPQTAPSFMLPTTERSHSSLTRQSLVAADPKQNPGAVSTCPQVIRPQYLVSPEPTNTFSGSANSNTPVDHYQTGHLVVQTASPSALARRTADQLQQQQQPAFRPPPPTPSISVGGLPTSSAATSPPMESVATASGVPECLTGGAVAAVYAGGPVSSGVMVASQGSSSSTYYPSHSSVGLTSDSSSGCLTSMLEYSGNKLVPGAPPYTTGIQVAPTSSPSPTQQQQQQVQQQQQLQQVQRQPMRTPPVVWEGQVLRLSTTDFWGSGSSSPSPRIESRLNVRISLEQVDYSFISQLDMHLWGHLAHLFVVQAHRESILVQLLSKVAGGSLMPSLVVDFPPYQSEEAYGLANALSSQRGTHVHLGILSPPTASILTAPLAPGPVVFICLVYNRKRNRIYGLVPCDAEQVRQQLVTKSYTEGPSTASIEADPVACTASAAGGLGSTCLTESTARCYGNPHAQQQQHHHHQQPQHQLPLAVQAQQGPVPIASLGNSLLSRVQHQQQQSVRNSPSPQRAPPQQLQGQQSQVLQWVTVASNAGLTACCPPAESGAGFHAANSVVCYPQQQQQQQQQQHLHHQQQQQLFLQQQQQQQQSVQTIQQPQHQNHQHHHHHHQQQQQQRSVKTNQLLQQHLHRQYHQAYQQQQRITTPVSGGQGSSTTFYHHQQNTPVSYQHYQVAHQQAGTCLPTGAVDPASLGSGSLHFEQQQSLANMLVNEPPPPPPPPPPPGAATGHAIGSLPVEAGAPLPNRFVSPGLKAACGLGDVSLTTAAAATSPPTSTPTTMVMMMTMMMPPPPLSSSSAVVEPPVPSSLFSGGPAMPLSGYPTTRALPGYSIALNHVTNTTGGGGRPSLIPPPDYGLQAVNNNNNNITSATVTCANPSNNNNNNSGSRVSPLPGYRLLSSKLGSAGGHHLVLPSMQEPALGTSMNPSVCVGAFAGPPSGLVAGAGRPFQPVVGEFALRPVEPFETRGEAVPAPPLPPATPTICAAGYPSPLQQQQLRLHGDGGHPMSYYPQ